MSKLDTGNYFEFYIGTEKLCPGCQSALVITGSHHVECQTCQVAHSVHSLITTGEITFTMLLDGNIRRPFQCPHELVEKFTECKWNDSSFLGHMIDTEIILTHIKGVVTKMEQPDDEPQNSES